MLRYKDKTFCKYYPDCKHGSICHRALTPQVIAKANIWWGKEGAPISVFTEEPECYEK